jgi:hypothetical protein
MMLGNCMIYVNKMNGSGLLTCVLLGALLLPLSSQADTFKWSISNYSPQQAPYKYQGQLRLQGKFRKMQGGRTVRMSRSRSIGPALVLPVISWNKSSIVVKITDKLIFEEYWLKVYDSKGNHIVTSSIPLKVSRPLTLADEPGGKRRKIDSSRAMKLGAGLKGKPTLRPGALRALTKSCADGFTATTPDSQGQYKCMSKKQRCGSGYKAKALAQYDAAGRRLYYLCRPE